MPKNIVICCDGTGNEVGVTISNVLKLFRVLTKDDAQRVYYGPGVGTIGNLDAWQRAKQKAQAFFGLATGYGLDADVLGAYRFLCQNHSDGDLIWLFGFSRGAYTVRVLAALLYVVGLLEPDQVNLAGYALAAYKKASADEGLGRGPGDGGPAPTPLQRAWTFGRVAGTKPVRVEFLGVWDTVASVIVPRRGSFRPFMQSLRYTRRNPIVKTFRQAVALDERRRMYRLNAWEDGQRYRADPFDPASERDQDARQVWFAGVHADIGGGYAEEVSGLSKFPLVWMLDQARSKGLRMDHSLVARLAWGRPAPDGKAEYAAPNAVARLHDSMTFPWWLLECVPKSTRWREWEGRRDVLGWYLPLGEPRPLPARALVHRSVLNRIRDVGGYRPANLPDGLPVEEMAAIDDHWDVPASGGRVTI